MPLGFLFSFKFPFTDEEYEVQDQPVKGEVVMQSQPVRLQDLCFFFLINSVLRERPIGLTTCVICNEIILESSEDSLIIIQNY